MTMISGRLWGWMAALLAFGWMIAGGLAFAQSGAGAGGLDQIEVLDLATAARIALEENPTLAAAQARIEQAREVVAQAQSAYWPRVDAKGSVSRVDLAENSSQMRTAEIFPFMRTENPEEYYRAGLTASWLLFDGFAREFKVAGARYGEQMSEAARTEAQRLLLASVAGAFLQAQLAQENIAIAQADWEFNQRLLTEARLRHQVGAGTLSDVLNFQIKANSAQSQRIQATQNFDTTLISLAALLGRPRAVLPDKLRLVPLELATPAELAPIVPQEPLETAYRLRPDLEVGERTIRQAEAEVKVAQAELCYPTVSLVAGYEGERANDAHLGNDDFGNTIGVQLTYNLFAGGYYKARHRAAKAKVRETEKDMEKTRIGIASEIGRVVAQVRGAQEQLTLQQDNTRLVEQNRSLVEKEYKAGVGSLVRLNEAQRDLIAAQVRLAGARVSLRQAYYDLQAATGEIVKTFATR